MPAIGTPQITDMIGKTHLFAHSPQHIVFTANIMPPFVTLSQSISSIAGATESGRSGMASGLFSRIYGELPMSPFAGHDMTPNFEQILRLSPDAVLAWAAQAAVLDKTALFDVVIFNTSYPLISSNIALWRLLGRVSDREARAESFLETYHKRMDIIADHLAHLSMQRARVLILVSNTESLWIGSQGHYLNERLALAGAENVVHGGISGIYSLEDIARLDPDVILIQSNSNALSPEDLFDKPIWQMIRAVQTRKVYRVPDLPLFLVPVFDPLLVEWLTEVLHPTSMNENVRTAFRRTYFEVYHYSLSETDLDMLLGLSVNIKSAGYERFARESVDP